MTSWRDTAGCLEWVAPAAASKRGHQTTELCKEEPAGAGESDYLSSGSFRMPAALS